MVLWREGRPGPEAFFWRGKDYLLRMRGDVDLLSHQHRTRGSVQALLMSLAKPLPDASLAVLLPARVACPPGGPSCADLATALLVLAGFPDDASRRQREWLAAHLLALEPDTRAQFAERAQRAAAQFGDLTQVENAAPLSTRI